MAALCAVFACATAVAAVPRPNLLLITVDDMNTDSVGVFGATVAETTPNIDQLAEEGLRFERAHVQVANCMPSRNVMWSGRYPLSNKIEGFYQVKDPGYLTLADYAKSAGYFTAIRHKAQDSTPYSPYGWDAVLDRLAGGAKLNKKDPGSYGQSTAEGIRLAKQAGKPFCLLINIADPHLPFFGFNRKGKAIVDPFVPSRTYRPEEVAVPGFLVDDPVVRQELAHYYSSVRRADDAVGQVLQALQESGEANRTLVLFLSDHGMPFPFAKTQLYHHSTSTPLIVRWPDVIKPGSVDRTHLVSAVDILPTLLDGIGEEIPGDLEGRTFLPLLRGATQDGRDHVFKVYNENAAGGREPMAAVESARFLYIFNPWSNGKRTLFSATYGTATYKRMLQLAEKDAQIAGRVQLLNHRVLEEFYDVQNDPDCLDNLIDDPAYKDQVAEYRGLLEQWLRKMQDPMLEVLLQRDDPAVLAAFMAEQQRQTRERKEWSRAIREYRKTTGG
ncbi:MAG: sulfatase [Halioglobus sp.]|nr:sulfatase [Halioglobus sp.]